MEDSIIIDISQYQTKIQLLKNVIGKEKIDTIIESYGSITSKNVNQFKKCQPLAYLFWYLSEKKREQGNNEIPPTLEIFQLIELERNIGILKDHNIKDLERKISTLFLENFEKTAYEIKIAAKFVKSGFDIEFINTTNTKTPDLLVKFNNGIEVECKKMDYYPKRDRNNKELFHILAKKSYILMDKNQKNSLVLLRSVKDLKPNQIPQLLKMIENLLKSFQSTVIRQTTNEFEVILYPTKDWNKSFQKSFFVISDYCTDDDSKNFMSSCDYATGQAQLKLVGENAIQSNPRVFIYKCANPPDKIKTLVNLLKSALQQVSGKRTSIICLENSVLYRGTKETNLERLSQEIDNLFRINTSISAIIVTEEFLESKPNKTLKILQCSVIHKNPKAKYPLPDAFKF